MLDAARANLPGLKAAVTFHGSLDKPSNKTDSTPIKANVLVLHAYEDKGISMEQAGFDYPSMGFQKIYFRFLK